MKYNQLYNDSLYTFFCRDNSLNIFSILKTFNGINVLYENGFFFSYAISKGNIEICQALLDYFETKQFPKKNLQYEEARNKLVEVLENIVEEMDISSEMKKVLSPYITFEGSEHNTLNDSFSDIDQTIFIQNVNKDSATNNFLNEEVLKKFEAEQNSQTKIIENLLGFGTEEINPQIEEHNTTNNVVLSGNNTHEVY
jgi:hypothetical protein